MKVRFKCGLIIVALSYVISLSALTPTPLTGLIVVIPFMMLVTIIVALGFAILLLPSSIIEWNLFKNKNVFEDFKQVYFINLKSLLWTDLCLFGLPIIFLATSYIQNFNEYWDRHLQAVPFLFLAIVFMYIKTRKIRSITTNDSIKNQIMLFTLIQSVIFSLLVFFYLLMRR